MVTTILGAPSGGGQPQVVNELPILVWIAADGSQFFLSAPGNGVIYMPGATGLDLPPFQLASVVAPALDGQVLRGVRADMRPVQVPIYIEADTRTDLRARVRGLAGMLDPRNGDGHLRVIEPDGTARQIACRYSDGLLGDESINSAGLHYRMMVLTFQAFNPFWSDLTSVSQNFPLAGGAVFTLPLVLPLNLAPSAVLGDVTITNTGDEPAYPLWTLTGPMTGITVTNNTYGESFVILRTLTLGHSITVNCDPTQLTIVDDLGANIWPYVGAAPKLWTLRPGDNSVSLTMTGAATGSNVGLEYVRRWKTS